MQNQQRCAQTMVSETEEVKPAAALLHRLAACGAIKNGYRPLCLEIDILSRPLVLFFSNCTVSCDSRRMLDFRSLNICQQLRALRIYLTGK